MDQNQKEHKTFLNRNLFFALASIYIGIIGVFYAQLLQLESRVDSTDVNALKIEAQLSQIQTDIQWIKLNLAEHAQ